MQQRTLEATASGSIPVVLDVRNNDSCYDKSFDSSMIFFNTPRELTELLKTNKSYNFDLFLKSCSYSKFIKRMISIVDKKSMPNSTAIHN